MGRTRRVLSAGLTACLAAALLTPASSPAVASPVAPRVSAGPAGVDYFTNVLGDPADMSNPEDLIVVKNGPMHGFTRAKVAGGVFSGVIDGSAYLSPVWSGYETGLFRQRDGLNPKSRIDNSKYNVFSARIYVSANVGATIQWGQCDDGFEPWCAGAVTQSLRPGWNFVRIRLGESSVAGRPRAWTDAPVTSIRLSLGSSSGPTTVKIDWMRLTPDGQSATLRWTNPRPGSPCELVVTAASPWTADVAAGGSAELGALKLADAASGELDLGFLPPGNYRFAVRPVSSVGQTVQAVSPEASASLSRPEPVIVSPDEGGNDADEPIVFDMSSPSQIAKTRNIGNKSWAGGTFTGTTLNSDGQIYLKLPRPIDPSVYDIAVIRMTYGGDFDMADKAGAGTMARLMWWTNDVGRQYMQTRDIITYSDSPETVIDLAERTCPPSPCRLNESDPITGPNPPSVRGTWARKNESGMLPRMVTQLRFDPNEDRGRRTFHIDEIRLVKSFRASSTGYGGLPTSATIRWNDRSGADSDGSSVVVGVDSDRVGFDGIVVGEATGGAGERGITWNSTGKRAGNYWPWVAITRGGVTSKVYGRAPVVVTNDQPPATAGLARVTRPHLKRLPGGKVRVSWVPTPSLSTTGWVVQYRTVTTEWQTAGRGRLGPWARLAVLRPRAGAPLKVRLVPLSGSVLGRPGAQATMRW